MESKKQDGTRDTSLLHFYFYRDKTTPTFSKLIIRLNQSSKGPSSVKEVTPKYTSTSYHFFHTEKLVVKVETVPRRHAKHEPLFDCA